MPEKRKKEKLKMGRDHIRLLEGGEVLKLLEDAGFYEKLIALYQESTRTTIFQCPEFIKSWYSIKSPKFIPLIVIEESPCKLDNAVFLSIKKEPSGFLKKKNVQILGLGEYDALYQTWLVREGGEGTFLPRAFEMIFNYFPNCKVVFKFIPYSKSLYWLKENPKWNKLSVVQPYRRPLLQMSHSNFKTLFKKRHLKAKYNRFRRAGKMKFEEITEVVRFIKVYDEVMVLYDFRQGALFNKNPSVSNSLSRPLFISLFKKKLLHVSVLKLDDTITSCIIGMKSKEWMHLSGLVTYSPFYSKLSPGLVHLYLLGQYLDEQGFCYFDLSPGDDEYKERLASNADEVFELSVSRDPVFNLKRRFRKKFHQLLLSKGIRPMTFNVQVQRSKQMIQLKLNSIKERIFPSNRKTMNNGDVQVEFEKNNIKQLLAFEDQICLSRWEFLSDAFKRVGSGETFFSWMDDNRLLAVVWFEETTEKNVEDTDSAIMEKNTYLHPTVLFRKEEIKKLAVSAHLKQKNCLN